MNPRTKTSRRAFSLVEVLAAVTIIGVITFLAIPNIVQVKRDSEDSLARARADALNLAAATYFQARGEDTAAQEWSSAGSSAAQYGLLRAYLSFAPDTLAEYMPGGYVIDFDDTQPHRVKAGLQGPGNIDIAY